MSKLRIIYLLSFAIAVMGCRKPYQPPVTTLNSNILVVEGLINLSDSTFIRLSRTIRIADGMGSREETGATLAIESDGNLVYPLQEQQAGTYVASNLNLNASLKYRVRIKTRDGSTYLSDFVEAKVTPPIDSVGFEVRDRGLQMYTNAHDDQRKTIYYRWDYFETWQFRSLYKSDFISDGKEVIPRNYETDDIYTCWGESKSSTIVLGSSAKLDKDVIHQNPLTMIPATSEKISIKYSTLVKQYALTKEAFVFWENMKKNTESLGSIFDAQPSQLTGNIHNIDNAEEPVIGYMSAGTVTQKRVFIAKEQLPTWERAYPFECGPPDSVWTVEPITGRRLEDLFFDTFKSIPLRSFYVGGRLAGHLGGSRECADCTIRGTNKRPAFWQ